VKVHKAISARMNDGFYCLQGLPQIRDEFMCLNVQVEISATRQELERVVELFKSEFQAARQIAAGLLKLLELPLSTSQPNLEQFSDAGEFTAKMQSPLQEYNQGTKVSSILLKALISSSQYLILSI
jgi:hypothetical protein